MSASDESLTPFLASDFEATPVTLASEAPYIAERELPQYGMLPEWVGEQPDDVPFDEFRRFQYDRLYFYPRRVRDGIEYYPVEFRTFVYYVGEVPSQVQDHFQNVVNPHLRTLFNTGVYQGWMDGFGFERHTTNREHDIVAVDEANNLGIGQWEVLVMQENGTAGAASGFFDPWKVVSEAPEYETWNVTYNDRRDSYEVRPQGPARERLQADPKQVYLNDRFIGLTTTSRGTVWLKDEYDTRDGTYKDSTTGQQMWARRTLVERAGMHPNELRAGGQVYKINEGPARIDLVSAQKRVPADFEAVAPDAIPDLMTAATELRLDEDATDFEVRRDRGDVLGKYSTPTTRTITQKTDWNTQPL